MSCSEVNYSVELEIVFGLDELYIDVFPWKDVIFLLNDVSTKKIAMYTPIYGNICVHKKCKIHSY